MADRSYGFTIKCIKHSVYATMEQLIVVMSDMIKCHKGILVEYVFEEDKLNRLHIHGMMLGRKGLFLSKFRKPFWHIHIDPLVSLADIENWTKYIHKSNNVSVLKRNHIIEQIEQEYSFQD